MPARKKRKPRLPPWKAFRIARFKLAPGDVLVLRTEFVLTRDQVTALRERLNEELPEVRTVILTSGLQLAVLTKADIERGFA